MAGGSRQLADAFTEGYPPFFWVESSNRSGRSAARVMRRVPNIGVFGVVSYNQLSLRPFDPAKPTSEWPTIQELLWNPRRLAGHANGT